MTEYLDRLPDTMLPKGAECRPFIIQGRYQYIGGDRKLIVSAEYRISNDVAQAVAQSILGNHGIYKYAREELGVELMIISGGPAVPPKKGERVIAGYRIEVVGSTIADDVFDRLRDYLLTIMRVL